VSFRFVSIFKHQNFIRRWNIFSVCFRGIIKFCFILFTV
jgi:hypothetical protein